MSLDFLQVQQQIQRLGDQALTRANHLADQRQRALSLLHTNSTNHENIFNKIHLATKADPGLRCAAPSTFDHAPLEPLDGHFSPPFLPEKITILAADGSQITPSRHEPVQYCLINVGAIQMALGSSTHPEISVQTSLMYEEMLYTETGIITEARLALMRDLNERKRLVELAKKAPPPVITFTDGPMELWGAKENEADFQKNLDEYFKILSHLNELGVTTAGYVDKPAADLVVRMLEIALLDETQLTQKENIRLRSLRGVIDRELFLSLLAPGERSTIFSIQSRSAQNYQGLLKLHFFYLNVGRENHPSLARVEIPAWVAQDLKSLGMLHAVLVQQCQIMGTRPYPYMLHRSHEAAVVTLEEKEQVNQMISLELRKRGIPIDDYSNKQFAKDQVGRTRLSR